MSDDNQQQLQHKLPSIFTPPKEPVYDIPTTLATSQTAAAAAAASSDHNAFNVNFPLKPPHLHSSLSSGTQLSYAQVQLLVTVMVFFFWLVIILTLAYAQYLKGWLQYAKSVCADISLKLNDLIDVARLRKLSDLRDKLHTIYYYVYLGYVHQLFRNCTRFLSTRCFLLLHTQSQVTGLARATLNNIAFVFVLLKTTRRAVATFADTFTHGLRRLLLVPARIRYTYLKCKREIASFWLQIEQLIQIVRMPIEFLLMLGNFLRNVVNFLDRVERPKFRWCPIYYFI